MPDSQVITKYLAESYPSLIPASHADEVKQLISRIHDINFFSLTYTGMPHVPQGSKTMLENQLKGDINERYRKAIEYKNQAVGFCPSYLRLSVGLTNRDGQA